MIAEAGRVYLLWGDDSVTRGEVADTFRARMLSRPCGQLNLSEFRAPDIDWRALITACDSAPFLDERRLVMVHHLFGWRPRPTPGNARDDGSGRLREQREQLLEHLPGLSPSTTLILIEGVLSPAVRTQIETATPPSRADSRHYQAPRGAELERWIARRAQRRGSAIGPGVAAVLRENAELGLVAIDQEIAKLVAYAGDSTVSLSDLRDIGAVANVLVFDLVDAVAERRTGDALAMLRRLLNQGQRAEEIFPQLVSLLRRLLICRLALDERVPANDIQQRHNVKIYDKLRRQANSLQPTALQRGLDRALEFDRLQKRGEVSIDDGLCVLVAELGETLAQS